MNQTGIVDFGSVAPRTLLIHCTFAHSGAWARFAQYLGEPARAFDAPGHGNGPVLDPDRDYQGQWVQAALDAAEGARIETLVGHSYGGIVALRLALERRLTPRHLVLVEPVCFAAARGTEAFRDHLAFNAGFGEALASGDGPTAARLFTELWGTGVEWERMSENQRDQVARHIHTIALQHDTTFEDAHGLLAPGRLEALDLPVLLVRGAQSPPIVPAIHGELAARLPRVQETVIEGAGHMAPITHAEEVAAQVARFCAKSAPRENDQPRPRSSTSS